MQQLLGNVTTEPDPDNSLTVHGLNWVLEEDITMGECKEQQSKHTVINYPMGVIPEFGNSMLFGRYSFPTKSCLIVLKHFLLGEETTSEDNHW